MPQRWYPVSFTLYIVLHTEWHDYLCFLCRDFSPSVYKLIYAECGVWSLCYHNLLPPPPQTLFHHHNVSHTITNTPDEAYYKALEKSLPSSQEPLPSDLRWVHVIITFLWLHVIITSLFIITYQRSWNTIFAGDFIEKFSLLTGGKPYNQELITLDLWLL